MARRRVRRATRPGWALCGHGAIAAFQQQPAIAGCFLPGSTSSPAERQMRRFRRTAGVWRHQHQGKKLLSAPARVSIPLALNTGPQQQGVLKSIGWKAAAPRPGVVPALLAPWAFVRQRLWLVTNELVDPIADLAVGRNVGGGFNGHGHFPGARKAVFRLARQGTHDDAINLRAQSRSEPAGRYNP